MPAGLSIIPWIDAWSPASVSTLATVKSGEPSPQSTVTGLSASAPVGVSTRIATTIAMADRRIGFSGTRCASGPIARRQLVGRARVEPAVAPDLDKQPSPGTSLANVLARCAS